MIPAHVSRRVAADALVSCGVGMPWHDCLTQNHLKLVFLGGSVTAGYAGGQMHADAYPQLCAADLRARGLDVTLHVLATAGMDSMQGNALAARDILPLFAQPATRPNLVILEFAINETTLRHSVLQFESLLRRFLEQEAPPIVCLLLLRSANDYSCESFMLPMAEHYGLPCISLRRGLNPQLAADVLQWTDYGDDEGHPTPAGHRLLADCLMQLLDVASASAQSPRPPLPAPWLEAPFSALRFYAAGECPVGCATDFICEPRACGLYHRAWVGTGGQHFTLTCTASTLVLFYEVHHLPHYGSARLLLDGQPVRHPLMNGAFLHGNSIYGWGNARTLVVFQHDAPQTHRVELLPETERFYLLGVGIV